MNSDVRELIKTIHQASVPAVFALTGGGAQATGMLLSVPGGSRTVLEVIVPYHQQALARFLGHAPEQFCSSLTSRKMAERARARARQLLPHQVVLGVGCTASLASDRPKRGEHRFHLSMESSQETVTWSLTLAKDARDREQEEDLLDRVLLNALAEMNGLSERVSVPLRDEEQLEIERLPFADAFSQFVRGEIPKVCFERDGRIRGDAPAPKLLMPGSYNPLHRGHSLLAEAAGRLKEAPVAFEISTVNVDKGEIPSEEVRRRAEQFAWHADLWLTREPTFVGKAHLFPGTTFVLGVDTAERMVMPRYYNDSEEIMHKTFAILREQGCRFFVAGRVDEASQFVTIDNVDVPEHWRDLFEAIPEAEFRFDLSSTAIRNHSS